MLHFLFYPIEQWFITALKSSFIRNRSFCLANDLVDEFDPAIHKPVENILDSKKSDETKQKLRKVAHWIIAATSLSVSVKAGVDLSMSHENVPHAGTIYASGASLALNGLMLARLRKGVRRKNEDESVYEHDLSKHFWAVDIPSAGLAVAGAALQRYNVSIEQIAAIASGVVGAYAFRPTKANLTHNCLDHGHVRADSHHKHIPKHHLPKRKSWLQRMRYKPRHALRNPPVMV